MVKLAATHFGMLLGVGIGLLFSMPVLAQATITVNTSVDNSISGDGVCSLREAITNANNDNDTTGGDCEGSGQGTDTIEFNISGAGPHSITPISPLPDITNPVIIDGETQSGADCGTSIPTRTLKIILDGSSAGAGSGIRLVAGSDGSTVRGLVIHSWSDFGVNIDGSGGNFVTCNLIGTDDTGTVDLGNGSAGVQIENGAPNNMIADNLISGNAFRAIWIRDSGTTGNLVQGNFIGTDITGTASIGTGGSAIGISIRDGASNNTIGGTGAGEGNIISGHGGFGISIKGAGTMGNLVQGNFIGTDITGTTLIGNGESGVYILTLASGNTVGGASQSAANVISGNGEDGVRFQGAGLLPIN